MLAVTGRDVTGVDGGEGRLRFDVGLIRRRIRSDPISRIFFVRLEVVVIVVARKLLVVQQVDVNFSLMEKKLKLLTRF